MLRGRTALILLFLLDLVSRMATGQWLNYPAAGIPRLRDGKPNLSAPTPRSPDGKPDLYGLWEEEKVQGPYQIMPLQPSAIKPEDVILTPEGETWQRQH